MAKTFVVPPQSWGQGCCLGCMKDGENIWSKTNFGQLDLARLITCEDLLHLRDRSGVKICFILRLCCAEAVLLALSCAIAQWKGYSPLWSHKASFIPFSEHLLVRCWGRGTAFSLLICGWMSSCYTKELVDEYLNILRSGQLACNLYSLAGNTSYLTESSSCCWCSAWAGVDVFHMP